MHEHYSPKCFGNNFFFPLKWLESQNLSIRNAAEPNAGFFPILRRYSLIYCSLLVLTWDWVSTRGKTSQGLVNCPTKLPRKYRACKEVVFTVHLQRSLRAKATEAGSKGEEDARYLTAPKCLHLLCFSPITLSRGSSSAMPEVFLGLTWNNHVQEIKVSISAIVLVSPAIPRTWSRPVGPPQRRKTAVSL